MKRNAFSKIVELFFFCAFSAIIIFSFTGEAWAKSEQIKSSALVTPTSSPTPANTTVKMITEEECEARVKEALANRKTTTSPTPVIIQQVPSTNPPIANIDVYDPATRIWDATSGPALPKSKRPPPNFLAKLKKPKPAPKTVARVIVRPKLKKAASHHTVKSYNQTQTPTTSTTSLSALKINAIPEKLPFYVGDKIRVGAIISLGIPPYKLSAKLYKDEKQIGDEEQIPLDQNSHGLWICKTNPSPGSYKVKLVAVDTKKSPAEVIVPIAVVESTSTPPQVQAQAQANTNPSPDQSPPKAATKTNDSPPTTKIEDDGPTWHTFKTSPGISVLAPFIFLAALIFLALKLSKTRAPRARTRYSAGIFVILLAAVAFYVS